MYVDSSIVPDWKIPNLNRQRIYLFADTETYLGSMNPEAWCYDLVVEDFAEYGFSLDIRKEVKIALANFDVIPWAFGIGHNGDYLLSLWDETYHEKVFKYIKRQWDKGYYPTIIFHNAAYDMEVLINTTFLKWDPNAKTSFLMTDDKKMFVSGGFFSESLGFGFEVRCSYLFEEKPLASCAKFFKHMEKGEIPYHQMDTIIDKEMNQLLYVDWYKGGYWSFPLDEALDYLKNDLLITEKYWNYINEAKLVVLKKFNLEGSRPPESILTQASLSRFVISSILRRDKNIDYYGAFKFNLPKEVYQEVQNSVCGGWTNMDKDLLGYNCGPDEKIVSYDIHNCYANVMSRGIPYGPLRPYQSGDENNPRLCVWVRAWTTHHVWKPGGNMAWSQTPPLKPSLESCETRKVFHYQIYDRYCFFLEESEIEWHEVTFWTSQLTFALKEFNVGLFNERLQIRNDLVKLEMSPEQRQQNDQLQMMLKTILNSGYGKLSERVRDVNTYYFNGHFYKVKEEIEHFKSTLAGIYVTQRAQIRLMKEGRELTQFGMKILYQDTDSHKFVIKKGSEHILDQILDIGPGLGQFGHEGTFDEYLSLGVKKKYAFINNIDNTALFALSGLSSKLNRALHKSKDQVKYLKIIFDRCNNLLCLNCKTETVKSFNWQQPIIIPTNVRTRSDMEHETHILAIIDGQIRLERC